MIKNLIKITYLTVICLMAVQVWLSCGRVTDGDKLYDAQNQITGLERENQIIKDKIYELSSLENISLYASVTGMQPAVITRLSALTVALKNK